MDSALTDDGMSAQFFLADHRFVAVQEHGHRGCVFTSTRLGILIHCTPVDTMYQRWPGLGASQPSHRVAGRPHKHVAEWRPRDHAASQPRGRASGFVRGRPARGPRAALQLPLRRSSTSQRWRRPRPRGSASAGAGTGYLRARPAPFLRSHRPAPHPVSGGSLLASARPAPCLYSHRPALQWGGGGKVVCINIICDTDKLTSGVKGPEFDSRSPP